MIEREDATGAEVTLPRIEAVLVGDDAALRHCRRSRRVENCRLAGGIGRCAPRRLSDRGQSMTYIIESDDAGRSAEIGAGRLELRPTLFQRDDQVNLGVS